MKKTITTANACSPSPWQIKDAVEEALRRGFPQQLAGVYEAAEVEAARDRKPGSEG